jgi:DHA1 family bicyclomycin/chloramphenicol resistance-like MFS transporter
MQTAPPTRVPIVTLALLSAIAPLATDMYLPGFVRMSDEFGTSASAVQLTLTAFMIGLAAGQLVVGPLSDRYGRRRPLLLSAAVCLAATVLCAVAPSVGALVVLRLVQGVAGAAGLVIGRAVITDTTEGPRASQLFGITMVIGGVAPVVAPLVGGLVVTWSGWRAVFWVLTAATALMLVLVALRVPETLPPERRRGGGVAAMLASGARLLRDRAFLGYTLTFVFAFAAMFAYISASPFVLEDVLGLSTGWYTVDFAVNAALLCAVAAVNGVLVTRVAVRRLLAVGVALLTATAVGLLLVALTAVSAWTVLPLLAVLVGSLGLILPNATALASERARDAAGTGSALLGGLQFTLAAVVTPLVGLGGGALPMALGVLAGAVISAAALTTLTRAPGSDPADAAPELAGTAR